MALLLYGDRVRNGSLLALMLASGIGYGIAANDSPLKSVAKSIWQGSDESPSEAIVIASRRDAPACIHNVVYLAAAIHGARDLGDIRRVAGCELSVASRHGEDS